MNPPIAVTHPRLANLLDAGLQDSLIVSTRPIAIALQTEAPRTPGASKPATRFASRQPTRAFDQALKLSLDHVLQHLLVQRQVRHDLLQPRILGLKLPHPPHLRGQQTGTFLLPVEERRFTD